MKLICSRARCDRYLSPRCSAKFGGVCRSLNAKFLQRVHGYQAVRTSEDTKGAECTSNSGSTASPCASSYVGAHPINHPIIRRGALAIHTELPFRASNALCENHAGCQLN